MNPVEEAMRMAIMAHRGQTRKENGMPYAVHPIEVAKTLANWDVTENKDIIIAAVMHDVIEDCVGIDNEFICARWGDIVGMYVRFLTILPDQNKIEYMRSLCGEVIPVEVKLIKLADRYCNVLDYHSAENEYSHKYAHKAWELIDQFASGSLREKITERFPPTKVADRSQKAARWLLDHAKG